MEQESRTNENIEIVTATSIRSDQDSSSICDNYNESVDLQTSIKNQLTESDKINNNEATVSSQILSDEFQSKLQVRNCDFDTSDDTLDEKAEWDLKTFLDESSQQRQDIDVFVMSEAGKPIYCYSGREDVTTLMGVCVALINYVIKTQQDQIRSIRTRNGLDINFSVRSPLIIIVVCRRLKCFDEQTLMNQIYAQLVSTITLKKLQSIFQQAPTYDLKRIIHKNDFKTLDILVRAITRPIAEQFPTYKNKRYIKKTECNLFNNVISFYTSSSISQMLRTSGSSSSANSSLIFVHDHKPNVLSRVYVPIAVMNASLREQINNIINQSVATNSDIVFSILFHLEEVSDNDVENTPLNHSDSHPVTSSEDDTSSEKDIYESFGSSQEESTNSSQFLEQAKPLSSSSVETNLSKDIKLISVCNHTSKFRISPLDIQLIYALIKASDQLLTSTESLWLPICLSRVDANRFLHAHVSYLSKKYCLILLDVDHNNFDKCRLIKETINFKLDQIRLAEPMTGLRSNISELGQPNLQYLCHQTPRNCILWQASIQTEFSPLNYYLIERMHRSSLKTLWLRSMKEQCALLGWQTTAFQLYAQFDGFVTKQSALETVTTFLKWFKKEEEKFLL